MLSTAARYVAQLMLPGGLGLRSTALTSSSISGIHDAADGDIGGTALELAKLGAVLAIASSVGKDNNPRVITVSGPRAVTLGGGGEHRPVGRRIFYCELCSADGSSPWSWGRFHHRQYTVLLCWCWGPT